MIQRLLMISSSFTCSGLKCFSYSEQFWNLLYRKYYKKIGKSKLKLPYLARINLPSRNHNYFGAAHSSVPLMLLAFVLWVNLCIRIYLDLGYIALIASSHTAVMHRLRGSLLTAWANLWSAIWIQNIVWAC